MKKLRIAITYIAYPVAMARYFHEALIRRKDVEVWSAGPYTSQWIPWGDGMHLPSKYLLPLNHPLPMMQPPTISYPMLEKHVPWKPDLWLEVNAGLVAIGRPSNAPLALVLTDPHVLGQHYESCRPRASWTFSMQTPYMRPGDIWLPYAYDPKWHAQTNIPIDERPCDAALIGLQYASRTHLVNRLRQPNQHPHRDGKGFKVFYELGKAYDDARNIYQHTVVGLNWSSLQDTTARCFELMAFGIAPVLNRVPDLMSMFQDRQDFLGFDTEDEAVALVHELLNDLDFAEKIGKQARAAVEGHTWDRRVETILEEVGLI